MSAKNYLIINRNTFEVSDHDLDTDMFLPIGKGKNINEAIDIATKYMEEHVVEYGCAFTRKVKRRK